MFFEKFLEKIFLENYEKTLDKFLKVCYNTLKGKITPILGGNFLEKENDFAEEEIICEEENNASFQAENTEDCSKIDDFSFLEEDTILEEDTAQNNENKSYFLYKHTCLVNDKVYYGITNNFDFRWKDGMGYISNKGFFRDIVLYGWCNFKHEILLKRLTKNQALFFEGMLIQETNSFDWEIGYNIQAGEPMKYEQIFCKEEAFSSRGNSQPRAGRNGRAVYFDGKIYSTIRALSEEINEDYTVMQQSLCPSSPRKMPNYLKEKGLRYATDEECRSLESSN